MCSMPDNSPFPNGWWWHALSSSEHWKSYFHYSFSECDKQECISVLYLLRMYYLQKKYMTRSFGLAFCIVWDIPNMTGMILCHILLQYISFGYKAIGKRYFELCRVLLVVVRPKYFQLSTKKEEGRNHGLDKPKPQPEIFFHSRKRSFDHQFLYITVDDTTYCLRL